MAELRFTAEPHHRNAPSLKLAHDVLASVRIIGSCVVHDPAQSTDAPPALERASSPKPAGLFARLSEKLRGAGDKKPRLLQSVCDWRIERRSHGRRIAKLVA